MVKEVERDCSTSARVHRQRWNVHAVEGGETGTWHVPVKRFQLTKLVLCTVSPRGQKDYIERDFTAEARQTSRGRERRCRTSFLAAGCCLARGRALSEALLVLSW